MPSTKTATLKPDIKHVFFRLWNKLNQVRSRFTAFRSADYWETRYATGGNSGSGSYGPLARYKAQVLNEFVSRHNVHSVVEFGCGDGHQLSLSQYPKYVGIDVSETAVKRCSSLFSQDQSKTFLLATDNAAQSQRADLALSLDVIYHLVEDETYETYMRSLFSAANRFVIIYSDNQESADRSSLHVRHRKFSDWAASHQPEWQLIAHIPNQLGSWSDFWIYAKSC
jgi:hypothetical protein